MKRLVVMALYLFTFLVAPQVSGLRSRTATAAEVAPTKPTADPLADILASLETPPAPDLVKPNLLPGEHWVPTFKLTEEVDGPIVKTLIANIKSANELGAEAILLQINSPGGSVWDGFDLMQAMEESNIPVNCVVDGMAASMAYNILQSCNTRMMTPRSTLMVHQAALGGQVYGHQDTFATLAARLAAVDEAMLWQEGHRLHITLDQLRAKVAHGAEWWTAFHEAKEVGQVDRVVKSIRQVQDSYRLTLHPPRKQVR